ncbi:MAG TPA: hypothetical protein VFE23_21135 [Usitatibacter sp.]|nr:hypothetical protein [Usitatibacter sp.]
MGRAALGFILSLACGLCQAANYSDIWWNPAESGWGLTIADHGTNLFGVWYTYRADGKPVWYTIPGGSFSSDRRTFTGDVYVTRGPAYTQAAFDASQVSATKVGSATFDFAPSGQPAGSVLFSYNVNGVGRSTRIERMSFGNASPQWGSDATDLWFDPAQSGWGVALAQHGNNVFGLWYAYDTDGQPLWFVVPGVQATSPTTFAGKLYSTTGPYFGNPVFDPSAVKVNEVGTAAFNANLGAAPASAQCDTGSATFTPTIATAAGTVQYQRNACTQAFGSARPSAGSLALQPKTCSGTFTITAVEPGGCTAQGTSHTYAGTISLQGIDWTRAGHQSGSLTLTNVPYLFMPMADGMMMGDMMMMGMDGPGACTAQILPTLTVPLDFTLANAVPGLTTSGTTNMSEGRFSYDLAVAPGSVSGHVAYTGSAFYTDAMTESGSFSCTAN